MLQTHSPFLKLENYLNCFAEATAWDEFPSVRQEADKEEAAVKWLALAILHGLSQRADSIEVHLYKDGDIRTAMATGSLPAPERDLACHVSETLRRVAHLDADQGSATLVLGIREDSLEFEVDARRSGGEETLTIRLPYVGNA